LASQPTFIKNELYKDDLLDIRLLRLRLIKQSIAYMDLTIMLALLSIVALASASACTPTYNSRPTAVIDSGTLVGTTTQISIPSATAPITVNKYLGIPFADKPERFRLAEPVSPWTVFFDASNIGPGCYEAISEDAYWYAIGAGLGLLPSRRTRTV
jgi:hypothetical protein